MVKAIGWLLGVAAFLCMSMQVIACDLGITNG